MVSRDDISCQLIQTGRKDNQRAKIKGIEYRPSRLAWFAMVLHEPNTDLFGDIESVYDTEEDMTPKICKPCTHIAERTVPNVLKRKGKRS